MQLDAAHQFKPQHLHALAYSHIQELCQMFLLKRLKSAKEKLWGIKKSKKYTEACRAAGSSFKPGTKLSH